MSRSKSSDRWLARQHRDPFVKKARAKGYRSRAAYKLLQILEKDHLLHETRIVVDLGAAPGGWSQVLSEKLKGRGRVYALDILPMEPLPGVEVVLGDFTEKPVLDLLLERLKGTPVDLVLSDMAPNLSGVGVSDQAKAMGLAELALDFVDQTLKPGGGFLVKVFQGAGFAEFRKALQARFTVLVTRKPEASRAESREMYLVAKGFKGVKLS
jgi:23S rRNA (uridine2552-2'-O)-methyltransferase